MIDQWIFVFRCSKAEKNQCLHVWRCPTCGMNHNEMNHNNMCVYIYIITYDYIYIYSHHLFCISFRSPSQSMDIHVPTVEPKELLGTGDWFVREAEQLLCPGRAIKNLVMGMGMGQ